MIEKWSKERDPSKPFCKNFSDTPPIEHALWVQAFHMDIEDRHTLTMTSRKKT